MFRVRVINSSQAKGLRARDIRHTHIIFCAPPPPLPHNLHILDPPVYHVLKSKYQLIRTCSCVAFPYPPTTAGLQNDSSDGDVRLVGGSTDTEGRVEVYHQGLWGTIYSASWDDNNARVVCRQLVLPYANATSLSTEFFGQGWGPRLLNTVHCSGRELRLTSCQFYGWSTAYYYHDNDYYYYRDRVSAGVRCGELVRCVFKALHERTGTKILPVRFVATGQLCLILTFMV